MIAAHALEATESNFRGRPRAVFLGMWIALVVALAIWTHFDAPGWDLKVYAAAMRSLRAGHDPYADAIAVQRLYHQQVGDPNGADRPYSYVYSPITLPFLRLIGGIPFRCSAPAYWVVFILAIVGQLPIVLRFAEAPEHRYFLYLTPAAAFFPGLLESDAVLSGNVAYILYFAVFWSALAGWRRGRWVWFYAAVLLSSFVKAPMLSLAVIPAFSARKQWLPAGLATAAGIALFAIQPLLWPSLFRNYLKAVDLQFLYNRDFGCSPAGLFGDALFRMGRPYSLASFIFYLCYAIPLFAVLLHLSRMYRRGSFSLRQWAPVMLVGVILLNPRIMEYDLAAITLPLAFIAWRFFARSGSTAKTILYLAIFFAVANAFGGYFHRPTYVPLLAILFAAGCWTLTRQPAPETPAFDLAVPVAP